MRILWGIFCAITMLFGGYFIIGSGIQEHLNKSVAPQLEVDVETIRISQRECLQRIPAHSFSLVQTQAGYLVQCVQIDRTNVQPDLRL